MYATMREGIVCQKTRPRTGENGTFRLTLPIFSFEFSAAAAPGITRETSSLRKVEINQLEKRFDSSNLFISVRTFEMRSIHLQFSSSGQCWIISIALTAWHSLCSSHRWISSLYVNWPKVTCSRASHNWIGCYPFYMWNRVPDVWIPVRPAEPRINWNEVEQNWWAVEWKWARLRRKTMCTYQRHPGSC